MLSVIALVIIASCAKNEVTNITLNKSTLYLIIGQNDSLSATVTATGDINKVDKTWSSSNPSVATVTKGIISGIGSGTADITVKAGKLTSTCVVTVDDKILPVLTQGELWYFGDAYRTRDSINGNGSNNFILYLASSGIRMDSLTGIGEILIIEFNTSLSVKDSIPIGTYDMMTDLKLINFEPYTLVPAYTDTQTGYHWGCWYYGHITAPIILGNMVVNRQNNVYVINYEFYDSYAVKISGNFHGAISSVNGTIQPTPVSIKNRMKLKSVNPVNKTLKFKGR